MVSFSLLNFFYSLLHNFKISAPSPPIDFTPLIFSLPDRPDSGQKEPKAGQKGQTQITSVRKIIGGVKTIGGGERGGKILKLWRREKIEEGKILRLWARE